MQEIVIGCGDFGAQVAAHLEARGTAGTIVLNLPAPARMAAAEGVRQRLRSLDVPEGALLHIPAAAGETTGSGILVAALAEWAERRTCCVWLALPQAQGDRAAAARTMAALLELEALRQGGLSFTCLLHEQGNGQAEMAQRFGDALLYRLRREVPTGPGYLGFGLGVIRDPGAALKRRLDRQVAMRAVEEYLRLPDPARALPGLREGLQRPIRPLLVPVEDCPAYKQRWSGALDESGELDSLLHYYAPEGEWHRQARQVWDQLIDEAGNGLSAAMAHGWRSGFATVYAEARSALDLAHAMLETEIARCEQNVAEHQAQFESAQAAAEQGDVDLPELDRLVAAYLLESMRLGALERLALAIDGILELIFDGLRLKVEKVERLLRAVQENRASSPQVRLAHALTVVPSAEQEQVWLGELQPRLTRALLRDGSDQTADQVLDSARADLDRFIRSENLDLHLPRGHRVRTEWLDKTLPQLRLAGVGAMPCVCEVSPGLPAEYQEELVARPALVQEKAVEWFPGEWVIYAETPPVELSQLTGLADWAEAYRMVPPPSQQGLHVLPEPPLGWPVLKEKPLTEVAAGLEAEMDADLQLARLALQCVLLGLVTPDEGGDLVLRVPMSGWVPGGPVGELPDLLAALAAEESLTALVRERWQQLSPDELAGYFAVLRWFETAVLDGDRGRLNARTLFLMYQAVEAERGAAAARLEGAGGEWLHRAKQRVGLIGTPQDDFSAMAGPWRHVRVTRL